MRKFEFSRPRYALDRWRQKFRESPAPVTTSALSFSFAKALERTRHVVQLIFLPLLFQLPPCHQVDQGRESSRQALHGR